MRSMSEELEESLRSANREMWEVYKEIKKNKKLFKRFDWSFLKDSITSIDDIIDLDKEESLNWND